MRQFGPIMWAYAAEDDCLRTSFPQLVGTTTGDTFLHDMKIDGTSIYSGGSLNGEPFLKL